MKSQTCCAQSMEMIALTTAMADARSAIQATIHEIRNYRRSTLTSFELSADIDDMLSNCNDILRVVQLHLWYLVRSDSLLQVPGTNADYNGKT